MFRAVSTRIEDYALIGDCEAAALVSRDGSIDWLCLPRFDSPACFAALLGTPEHGRWRIAPCDPVLSCRRAYREGTLVLETEFTTRSGRVAVIDFMPVNRVTSDVVRIVEGRDGVVPMEIDLILRFDYGSIVPWVRHGQDPAGDGAGAGLRAIAGPDTVRLRGPVPLKGENFASRARFEVHAGQRLAFDLTWYPSHTPAPGTLDAEQALSETEAWWRKWGACCKNDGPWAADVQRSLITLKALTYAPTGGILAAPTTSLPERLGGVRNWDYRYCWLRDATFTLYALVQSGFVEEARSWREWLLRAVAGKPSQLQLMYGIAGERRLPELELPWLPGYEGSAPVRIGNQAHNQRQLDVFGEVLDTLYTCWQAGIGDGVDAQRLERALVEYLEQIWTEPDEGIWEVRGPRRHFTHSKMMAWVALDRAVKGVEHYGLCGPAASQGGVERWRTVRQQIHDDVCRRGYSSERGAFVQSYESTDLDASLLMMPLVGFLPPEDARVRGTVAAIQRELMHDGLVRRYIPRTSVDGLPPGEGAFLLCTFWLADNLELLGRHDEAVRTFERVLQLRNDVGLLSESYDPVLGRMLGNFPQAFSHVGLVNTARNLRGRNGPAQHRPKKEATATTEATDPKQALDRGTRP
jgi:GH15 family glucan-1,4-alpha-glucosidase